MRDDFVIHMAAQGAITDLLHAETTLAKKTEGTPVGMSPSKYSLSAEENPSINLHGANDRIRVAALNSLIGKQVWPANALFIVLKFYSLKR